MNIEHAIKEFKEKMQKSIIFSIKHHVKFLKMQYIRKIYKIKKLLTNE